MRGEWLLVLQGTPGAPRGTRLRVTAELFGLPVLPGAARPWRRWVHDLVAVGSLLLGLAGLLALGVAALL